MWFDLLRLRYHATNTHWMTFSIQYAALHTDIIQFQTLILTSSFDQMPSITAPHICSNPKKDDLTFDMIPTREVQNFGGHVWICHWTSCTTSQNQVGPETAATLITGRQALTQSAKSTDKHEVTWNMGMSHVITKNTGCFFLNWFRS